MIVETIPAQKSMPESDLIPHIEDTPELIEMVNAIRNGVMVQVSWNDLTQDERRAANAVTFALYNEQ